MDFQEKGKKRYPLLKSFSFACQGILEAVRTERNIQIHFVLTAIVILWLVFLIEWDGMAFHFGGHSRYDYVGAR